MNKFKWTLLVLLLFVAGCIQIRPVTTPTSAPPTPNLEATVEAAVKAALTGTAQTPVAQVPAATPSPTLAAVVTAPANTPTATTAVVTKATATSTLTHDTPTPPPTPEPMATEVALSPPPDWVLSSTGRNWQIEVLKVTISETLTYYSPVRVVGSGLKVAPEGYVFLLVTARLTNLGRYPENALLFKDIMVSDTQGRRFTMENFGRPLTVPSGTEWWGGVLDAIKVPSGGSLEGPLAFLVPTKATGFKLEILDLTPVDLETTSGGESTPTPTSTEVKWEVSVVSARMLEERQLNDAIGRSKCSRPGGWTRKS